MYFYQYLAAFGLVFCLNAQEQAVKPDQEKIERGRGIFTANCAFCHGSSATGGEGGPDLLRSVLVLHDTSGDKIGPVILNGRPAKGMPKFGLSDAQVSDIAAFLKAQEAAAVNRFGYKIQNIVTGDAKTGQAYFETHCAGCHSATGDLKGLATRYEAADLQSRFLYPKTERWPGQPPSGPVEKPAMVTVKMPDGQTISGTLEHLDSFNVAFYDSDGSYHSLLLDKTPGIKVEVHDPLAGHVALLQEYSDRDMHNILAYLETLK